MIPMVNLRQQYASNKQEIDAAILDALANTQFILGPNVQAFERESTDYLGIEHAVTCASGTDALHLALRAAGIGPGDEVITSPFTFIATAEAIRYVGATPVFVDIDPQTFNIDVDCVERAITPNTRAVMPVHLFGQPVDMTRLMPVCEAHHIEVIEDCAQSFGAHIEGKYTGTFGSFGCFSFYPSKNLNCYGDGGLVITHSEEHAANLRSLRNHGSQAQYQHDRIGYNSRLDELQAVILRINLQHIDDYNSRRRKVANLYNQQLAATDITLPFEDGIGHHVYHQYTLLSSQRDKIITALREAQIGCAIYYPIPLHKQPVFADDCKDVTLPVSERIVQECFSLPMNPELTAEQIDTICQTIKQA